MKRRELHPLVWEVLDGERAASELPPELQSEAEAARRLLLDGLDRRDVTLSSAVELRVMERVRRRARSPGRRVWEWLSAPTVPRWAVPVSVAVAAGLALLVRLAPTPARQEARVTQASASDTINVRFELYAPGAHRVALAGTFNRWDPAATLLSRVDPKGVWTVTLPLPAGQHQYGFIVDGRDWVIDPAAPTVDDGFGRRNSVVSVSAANGRIL